MKKLVLLFLLVALTVGCTEQEPSTFEYEIYSAPSLIEEEIVEDLITKFSDHYQENPSADYYEIHVLMDNELKAKIIIPGDALRSAVNGQTTKKEFEKQVSFVYN